MTRERVSRILELREIPLSFQNGHNRNHNFKTTTKIILKKAHTHTHTHTTNKKTARKSQRVVAMFGPQSYRIATERKKAPKKKKKSGLFRTKPSNLIAAVVSRH